MDVLVLFRVEVLKRSVSRLQVRNRNHCEDVIVIGMSAENRQERTRIERGWEFRESKSSRSQFGRRILKTAGQPPSLQTVILFIPQSAED